MGDYVTRTSYDPLTGAVKYTYTAYGIWLEDHFMADYVTTATAYDLENEKPWSSYTIKNNMYGPGTLVLESTEARMDDGSSRLLENEYFGILGNYPVKYMDRFTAKDAEGRVDYTFENWMGIKDFRAPSAEYQYKALDYDTETGQLAYSLIRHWDGRTESMNYDVTTRHQDYAVTTFTNGRIIAEDYNPATGLLDYVLTIDPDGHTLAEDYDAAGRLDYVIEKWADGRQVASDYNPATGLLDYVITSHANGHTLAEDYDAAGRLDYVIERWADGRMVATDYDLTGQHPWTTYTIAYNAAGQIENAYAL